MLKFLSKYSKNIKQTPHYEKGDIMGDVALVYKVAAEDQDNLENIEAEIKKIDCGKLQWIKREPFVFGMELIKVAIVVPDKVDGAVDKVEEFLTKIKGVSNVDMETMTLA